MVVPAPAEPGVEAACQRLTAALPQTLGEGVLRRPVTGDPDRTAAWGDPAITLVCGSGPSGVSGIDGAQFAIGLPGSSCVVEEPDPSLCMSFLQRDDGAANSFTTYERAINARVRVPDAYDSTVLRLMLEALVTLPSAQPGRPG